MEVDKDMDIYQDMVARAYQAQLEEIAMKKNTIIHLPTGSGKTFIATRIITRLKKDLQKPWGEGGKRTFFLVNNVPLVNQQKKVIEGLCPVTVGGYSGEDMVDHWNKNIWNAELSAHEVIVMTGQILSDMLTHSYIKIEDINLIIFDECHHAVEDHMMRLVMKHFENCPVDKQPRVLGLTATLLNGNVPIDRVQSTLRELETTFHATIATASEMNEVLSYSTNPRETILCYDTFQLTTPSRNAVEILNEIREIVLNINLPVAKQSPIKLSRAQRDISSDPKKIVKHVKNMIDAMVNFIQSLGVYGGSLGILAYIFLLERLKRRAANIEETQLYELTMTHVLKARMVLLEAMKKDSGYKKIVNHSSEQVLLLLKTLKEYNPDLMNKPGVLRKINIHNAELSAIIFARERFTAKILFNLLKDVKAANPDEFGFLKHDYITGFNINPFKNTREDSLMKKYSKAALLKFCHQDLNCLISTSVIEEGIDITQCKLVIRYDPPLEYRSYIQSKGRARSKDANYVMLIENSNKDKFCVNYRKYQAIENYIREILGGNTHNRVEPSKEDIAKELYEDEDIPPYTPPSGGRLSAVSAISLISRYCSILPHDQFTVITPTWIEEKVNIEKNEKVMVTLIMPIECPIKEPIQGKPMFRLKAAKRAAALNACIKLHQAGELDPITLLPRSYGKVDFDQIEVRNCFPNWPWNKEEENLDIPRTGSSKRKRKVSRIFPTCLNGSTTPSSESDAYLLHIIKLDTSFPEPKDPREKALYTLLKREQGFGFLTLHPLPRLCDFPMFLTVGEVKVSLATNYAVLPLDTRLLNLIKQFHYLIFDQLLAVAKKYVVFDGTENVMYAVPVLGSADDFDIDWNTINNYKEIPTFAIPTFEERKSICVDVEEYKYSVVTPWYRTITLDRYIVSNVLEYLTPESRFDSDAFVSYEEYFNNKYNLTLVGPKDQPMLQVRKINSRMNCLLPRATTINAFTEKQQRIIAGLQGDDNPKGFAETFIPEYCIKYDFPGVYWYKAMMLPSIIHRVNQLLVADELRKEISLATKYGKPVLTKNESWKPIVADEHIAINSLRTNVDEPAPSNSIDRINQPVDPDAVKPPTLTSMKESTYRIRQQKLNKEYPWDASLEPVDIERNISTVTVVDLECYDEFVTTPLFQTTNVQELRSPPLKSNTTAAILPPPLKYNDKLAVLSLKPEGLGPELRDMVAALTTINSHDTFNLERAETLGDSFLKFAATLYLYHKFPTCNEGQLTNIKGKLIGNRNLFYAGDKVLLGGRMKVEQFSPLKDFLVPGYFAPKEIQKAIEEKKIRPTFLIGIQFSPYEAITGCLSTKTLDTLVSKLDSDDGSVELEPENEAQNVMQAYIRSQVVSDKSVADCVEAIIGTYLLSGGVLAAVKVLEWFKIIPEKDNLTEMLTKQVTTVIKDKKATEEEVDFLLNYSRSDIERILNYKFKDPSLILEALSHPSYIRNRLTRSYERLEFLGDAILDFLITSHIFENSKDFKPGDLTDLRSALVNNVTFASYVVKLELHKYLCSTVNPTLDRAIITFVEHQEQRDHQIVEDVLYLIDEEDCHIAEYVEVPKVLSDIFESLIGAIYLDTAGDLARVWRVIYRIMHAEIDSFSKRIPRQPVRLLYENIHACPVFGATKLANKNIIKVMIPVTFTKDDKQITVYGFGGNKFQAKRAAAKMALKVLAL